LVERYKGFIAVRDRVRGECTQGACFEVALPKAEIQNARETSLEGVQIAPWSACT
jgi:hypothetical protein